MKVLVKDGKEGLDSWKWDEGIQKRFKFDKEDIELLEEGKTLFRGETAFFLEEEVK